MIFFFNCRFYLGLALLQQVDKSRDYEAAFYLHQTLEHLMYQLTITSESLSNEVSNHLQSDILLNISNVQCLKGFLCLGKYLTTTTKELPNYFMKPDEIFRSVSSLAVRALCSIIHKGELYHQIERIFLEAHSSLLKWMMDGDRGIQDSVVATRCHNLCSLLKVVSLPKDNAFLELQEKVSKDCT